MEQAPSDSSHDVFTGQGRFRFIDAFSVCSVVLTRLVNLQTLIVYFSANDFGL